jgi:hypothetical protein
LSFGQVRICVGYTLGGVCFCIPILSFFFFTASCMSTMDVWLSRLKVTGKCINEPSWAWVISACKYTLFLPPHNKTSLM